MPTRKTLSLLIISLLVLACDSEKVLYEIKLPKPKISEASFGKDSSFLKWNIKKIPQEKIFRYAFSYGIVGGATLESRKIVHTNTLGKGFRITGLKEGENHWIKVQAVYAEFLGPWSDAVEGITGKPEPPLDFTVEKKTEDAKWYVNVSWNDHPANEEEKLEIKKYHVKCWDENDPTKKYEISGNVNSVSTQGKLETTRKAKYVCSVQTETDKGTKSEVKQSTGIEFHDIEVPSLSSASVAWGTVITFAKSTDHSYKLKERKDGVRLDTSKTLAEITATKPVVDVVVVATRAGYTGTAESKKITFTRQEGDTFSFSQASYSQQFNTNENKFQPTPTITDAAGDTRDLKYRIVPSGSGASIDADSGEVSITVAAVGKTFTVTASKAVSEKYEAQSADYQLEIRANTGSSGTIKPAFSSTSVAWGTAITFAHVAGYSYSLQDDKGGVVRLDTSVDPAKITATQEAVGVVIVAKRTGYADSVESDAITFTKQAGTTLSFAQTTQTKTTGEGSFTSSTRNYEFTLQSLTQGAGADSRTIAYSTTRGTIDTAQTKLTIRAQDIADLHKTGESITITASKNGDERYREQTTSYTLTIRLQWTALEKPRLSASGAVMWDEDITFAHVADHSYSLKDDKGGTVNLSQSANGLTWTVSATKLASGVVVVATHEYTGESEESAAIDFTKHSLRGKVLRIAPGTTSIGDYAFYDNELETVTIPNSVKSIGDSAFGDNKLETVTIPNSVTSIGDSAFWNNKLTSVTIPNSVTSIGDSAFGDNKLKTVTIPNSVTSIGDYAFSGNKLETVTIPNSVTSIGKGAFNSNKLKTVTIPNSVTSIGGRAFAENELTSVTIGNSVKSIGGNAFRNNKLKTVTIPNSVTSIGDYAFSGNKLETVTIPNSVTSIDKGAFNSNKLKTVTIPNSVTSIGDGAFNSNKLETVTIPNSVTSIGDGAFNSNKLETVTIPNSVTSIGKYTFSRNELETVVIPNSVISIGDGAFSSNKLETVTIPNSVKSIGDGAFSSNKLETVTIPNSVKSIGDGAFSSNPLRSVEISKTLDDKYSAEELQNRFGRGVAYTLTTAPPATTP